MDGQIRLIKNGGLQLYKEYIIIVRNELSLQLN